MIEYDDIELLWVGEPPVFNRVPIERLIRSDLRRNVLPMNPSELRAYFVGLPEAVVFIYGQADSDAFHCIYFI